MKKIKSRIWRNNKYKFFRRICSLFIVVIVFYFSNYVDAGMNDSLLEKNRVKDVYASVVIDGKPRIFYLNVYEMNGRVAYCIELGVDITTSIYHSTNDFSISDLTEDKIDYIKKVSYFGYGYEGHDDYKYYMASQEIIWEYLNNVEVEWTNELTTNGQKIDIEIYKNEILNLINFENEKGLDFGHQVSDVYTVGERIILNDNSGFLSNYEVVSSKYSDAVIEGDNLVIDVGNVIGDEVIELRRKDYYDYDSLLYYYDTSQRLISNGNYSDSDVVICFKIEGAVINGKVVQSNKNYYSPDVRYDEAIYEVYDNSNNLIGTYETDINGNFKIDNLLLGTYYIKQIKASEGFLVSDEVISINIDKKINDVILKQDFITNKFRITKVYGSNGNYKPEYGVSFRVYYSDGSHYCCLSTNKDGIDDFELAYGRYRISQVNTLFGYSKVDDFVIEVNDDETLKKYYNLVDEMVQVKVKVISTEYLSKKSLNLDGFSYRIRKKGESTYLEFAGENVIDAGSDGVLVVPGFLGYGDYVLEQVSVPEGVLLNEKVKEFRIDDNSNIELISDNLVMNVEFYNELVMGEVNILSLEEQYYKDTNNYGYKVVERENAEYSLIANEDILVNGDILYSSDQEVYRGTTVLGKLVIDNLYLGSYCLIDQGTYEKKCFSLKSIDDRTRIVHKSLEFVKYLDKHSLIIRNMSDDEEVIVNSVFEVLDNEDEIIYTGITNEEGIIKVDNLLAGNYCIRQKKVSSKYEKENEELCFLLDDDKKIAVVNNIIIKELVNVPNTLSKEIGFYEVGVIWFLIGTGIFVYKKIFASKLYR